MVGIALLLVLLALLGFAVRQRLARRQDAPSLSPEDIKLQTIITNGVRRGALEAIGVYLAISALIAFLIWVLNVSYQFG
ncbi:MAG TPA: hypothetical protein VEL79_03835 [Vicinamibacterales bacterium]|nr:hypothetical protein [Vicinamibacterales bacterium]